MNPVTPDQCRQLAGEHVAQARVHAATMVGEPQTQGAIASMFVVAHSSLASALYAQADAAELVDLNHPRPLPVEVAPIGLGQSTSREVMAWQRLGFQVDNCIGSRHPAPWVDGACLRRLLQEYGVLGTDDMDAPALLGELVKLADAYVQQTPPAAATYRWAHRVEEDRYVVLLACGHWTQTRVPEPLNGRWDCMAGHGEQAAADLEGRPAVLVQYAAHGADQ